MVGVGDVFDTVTSGKVTVVEYISSSKVLIRFCLTGFTRMTTARNVVSGNIKDPLFPSVFGVGFIGVGRYSSSKKSGGITAQYSRWHGMLERCYSERYHSKKPSYVGCKVCPEWHNFQAFAEWFDANHIDGFELDKDKLGNGKLYSPKTCCFISRSENIEVSQSNKYTLLSPSGDIVEFFNMNKFCRDNGLASSNVFKVLRGIRSHHKGWKRG